MADSEVAAVRRFNRLVTQRVGALHDSYMARGRPLGESRVLWEIGDDGVEVRRLRDVLGLDSGYLSRLLGSLRRAGLVEMRPSPEDGRVRRAHLTARGASERGMLDQLSDDLASSMLEPLAPSQRSRLVAAMAEVERLLTAGTVEIVVEDPCTDDARFCIGSYFEELAERFDTPFDPTVTTSADAAEITEPAGLLLVARHVGRPVGCGALKIAVGARAEVKRLWVSPDARGLGLGRRILAELEVHARRYRVDTLRLDTNRALTEAIALYRSAGYVEIDRYNDEPYAHHWFEKRLGPEPPP